ncbi:alpha/beta hydrolase family protein [Candidatus Latescibacterota bacterium]
MSFLRLRTDLTIVFLAAICIMFFNGYETDAQDDLSILNWKHYSDKHNALYREIVGEAYRYLDARDNKLSHITTEEQFAEYRDTVRSELAEAFGPLPEHSPLNPRVTGTLEHEGIVIQKVIIESRPGFQVTGCVFKKRNARGRLPAVLYVCGHTADGFRSPTYQHVILNLASKGFLVYAIDPVGQGERLQYYDQDKKTSRIGGPTSQHSYAGLQYLYIGKTMAMVRLWDCIRAVDYLCDRPDVDTQHIGVQGRSGGGTMSSFLGAMDDRITAAAPECYITSYRRLLESIGPQDAEQHLLSQISRGLDHGDFLIARAPKPTLVVTTTRDFFSIQGARETVQSIKSLNLPSATGKLSLVEDDAPHQSTKKNREAVYAFFMDAFSVSAEPTDVEIPPLTAEQLTVTESGQTVTSGSKSVHDLIVVDADEVANNLRRNRKVSSSYRSSVITSVKELSGLVKPGPLDEPVFRGRFVRDGYAIEQYILDGEGDMPLPVLLFVPEGGGEHQGLIYLNPDGKGADAGENGTIEKLVRRGYCVVASDLPGWGELAPETRGGDSVIGGVSYNIVFGAQLIGRSITGIQAGHILRICRFLQSRGDIEPDGYLGVAQGIAGPSLLHAAVADECIGAVAIDRSLMSWQTVVESEIYDNAFGATVVPSALTAYDLIDLMCVIAPRKILVSRPVGGNALPLNVTEIAYHRDELAPYFHGKENLLTAIHNEANSSFENNLFSWLDQNDR